MPISPLYVSEKEAATLLRHDVDWLHKNAHVLEESSGFPKIDPVVGMRHYEAIVEWARERNIRRRKGHERLTGTNQENHNGF